MKIIETLSSNEIIDLYDEQTVGFFKHLIYDTESPLYSHLPSLCLEYYAVHSAEKTISPSFNRLINNNKDTANMLIGSIIGSKFKTKWERIYNVLISEQYQVLIDNEYSESNNSQDEKRVTYNTSLNRNISKDDTITYDVGESNFESTESSFDDTKNTTTNQKKNVEEITSRTLNIEDGVYGFNSPDSVGDSTSEEESNQTIKADKDKNTIDTIENISNTNDTSSSTESDSRKTGTETTNITETDTNSKTGNDLTEDDHRSEIVKKGRNNSAAYLIQKELDLRNRNILFDIIFADIDSVTTLKIYI